MTFITIWDLFLCIARFCSLTMISCFCFYVFTVPKVRSNCILFEWYTAFNIFTMICTHMQGWLDNFYIRYHENDSFPLFFGQFFAISIFMETKFCSYVIVTMYSRLPSNGCYNYFSIIATTIDTGVNHLVKCAPPFCMQYVLSYKLHNSSFSRYPRL